MLQRIEKIENRVIRKYGFENKRTIITFNVTGFLRRFIK